MQAWICLEFRFIACFSFTTLHIYNSAHLKHRRFPFQAFFFLTKLKRSQKLRNTHAMYNKNHEIDLSARSVAQVLTPLDFILTSMHLGGRWICPQCLYFTILIQISLPHFPKLQPETTDKLAFTPTENAQLIAYFSWRWFQQIQLCTSMTVKKKKKCFSFHTFFYLKKIQRGQNSRNLHK